MDQGQDSLFNLQIFPHRSKQSIVAFCPANICNFFFFARSICSWCLWTFTLTTEPFDFKEVGSACSFTHFCRVGFSFSVDFNKLDLAPETRGSVCELAVGTWQNWIRGLWLSSITATESKNLVSITSVNGPKLTCQTHTLPWSPRAFWEMTHYFQQPYLNVDLRAFIKKRKPATQHCVSTAAAAVIATHKCPDAIKKTSSIYQQQTENK